MTTKIHAASAGYISPNDLGYVDLPREAVLNNTVSPSEKRAFATIAAIPMVIPAALFATEATLLAGLLALVGCGSPGEAEDPILTSFSDVGHGEISPDAGTTDEGDGLVTTDDGMTDTGDTLVAADDGGMSGPDEGVTIADVVEPQDVENAGDVLATADDGTTIADVLLPPEDGVQDLSDASEVKDGPDVVDSGDGLNADDDGASIIDVVTPPDVALPEDGVQDLSDASEAKDVPDIIDNSDGLVAVDDEVADSSDVAPPLDGSADQGETAVGTDATADSSQPCSPSCTPVAETVTCDEGSTNIAVNYFVKCATQFVCDGVGTSPVSVNLPDPTTQTTQSVTVDKCVSDILFGGCQAINGELSEYCGAVKVEMKPKANTAPTVDKLSLVSVLPSGNGCFGGGNTLTATWSGLDLDGDVLACKISVADAVTNQVLTDVKVSQPSGANLTANIPTDQLVPFHDYNWSVSCEDPSGAKGVKNAPTFTTYHKNTRLWYRFMDGAGNKVTDSGPSKLDGQIVGVVDWVVKGGINLNGATHISTPKAPFFTSMNELSVLISFTPANLNQTTLATLFEVSNAARTSRYVFDIKSKNFPRFIEILGINSYSVVAPQSMALGLNTMMATHDSSGSLFSNWISGAWQAVSNNTDYKGPLTTDVDGTVTIGCWGDSTHCYLGQIQELIVVENNLLSACK